MKLVEIFKTFRLTDDDSVVLSQVLIALYLCKRFLLFHKKVRFHLKQIAQVLVWIERDDVMAPSLLQPCLEGFGGC